MIENEVMIMRGYHSTNENEHLLNSLRTLIVLKKSIFVTHFVTHYVSPSRPQHRVVSFRNDLGLLLLRPWDKSDMPQGIRERASTQRGDM